MAALAAAYVASPFSMKPASPTLPISEWYSMPVMRSGQ
jgi:hypothetical protein